MGLKITQERLNLWHKGKVRDSIRFSDLKSSDGAALGTRVEVLL